MEETKRGVILALDRISDDLAIRLVRQVGGGIHAVKINGLWNRYGPPLVSRLLDAGAPQVWVDAKLHDTPDTVADSAAAIAESRATMLTVHTGGGIAMMAAARRHFPGDVFGVTVLTSLTEEDTQLNTGQSVKAAVLKRAQDAKLANLTGVVCSAQELTMLKGRGELEGLRFVVPGTRSKGKDTHDQKRVDTPGNAVANGASFLVIGRQIVAADDPVRALQELEQELKKVHRDGFAA